MIQNNSVNSSISGATALKLEEEFEVREAEQSSLNIQEENVNAQEEIIVQNNSEKQLWNTLESNSLENETNTETLSEETLFELDPTEQISSNEEDEPKLFSEETSLVENNTSYSESEQKLFEQENNQEEDFEIPAFLRRQKF
jgi:cell division protein FtsZ